MLLLAIFSGVVPDCDDDSSDDDTDRVHHISSVVKPTNLLALDGVALGHFHMQEVIPNAVIQSPTTELGFLVENSREILKLSASMQELLFDYLKRPAGANTDCKQFAAKLLLGKSAERGTFAEHCYSINPFTNEENLELGDVIGLSRRLEENLTGSLTHVAVKLANDLYISKAGLHADFLLISNLDTMVSLWKSLPRVTLKLR
jgi:hypothetical protein